MLARRTPGHEGTPVRARTNAFEMRWNRPEGNKGFVYHYDAILPLWDTGTRDFKLGNKKGSELVMRLQTTVRPDLFNPLGAYDGKKNLFSFQKYSVASEEFHVAWEERQTRPKKVTIKIVFVKKIDVGTLGRLVKGDPRSINPESDSATAINMLNLFIQSTPRMTDPRIHNVKSFFTPVGKRASDAIRPLELWRGHFQSVRPSFDRIFVNVDVTVGVVLPGRSLEQICVEHLRLSDVRDLYKFKPHDPKIGLLRLFLRGVKVEVDLPSHFGKRPKTIKDVLENVGAIMFNKGAESVSIADHFATAHGRTIRQGSIGVRLGSDGIFPIAVLKTIQQLFKNRASPDVVREALEFSPPNPHRRLKAITDGWQELKYTSSPFLIGAGISVQPEPLHVEGRMLPSPKIRFGDRNEVGLMRPGQWDVMRKKFFKPARLGSWIVVDFANCERSVLNRFIDDLLKAMRERGMEASEPLAVERRPGNADVEDVLRRVGGEAQARLILVILPESAAEVYRRTKRFGDIHQGVVTQCVKWSRKLAVDASQGRANQYHNSLLLKINVKRGGINHLPFDNAMAFLGSKPTMVLGADVSHPGPGSLLPSISALVASMDQYPSRYMASIRVQESRTEIIQDLAEMFELALRSFKQRNNFLPARLLVFRDGVSEGEFLRVRDGEVSAMQVPIEQYYGADRKKWPELIFIVVGKRHHFRFFPMDDRSQDPKGNGNLRAGFVVDQNIVHPVYEDFYLQSQPGLKGTSRPSHYTVLINDPKLNADQLQQIAYTLCHCYSRATRSVKIPAPVYYADLVCRRAKFHFSDSVGDIDVQSATSEERQHVDFFKAHFAAINQRMQNEMYFV